MELIDTTTAIDTPERVQFRFRLAGPGQRAAALGIDLVLQGLVLVGVAAVGAMGGMLGDLAGGVTSGLALALTFVVSWLYGALFEWAWAGQTPGKAGFGLRVVRWDGAPIGWRDAVLRNLMRGADSLPVGYVLGGVVATVDPRMRRLGDLVAGTMVVTERSAGLGRALEVVPPVTEAERQALPTAVHLSRDERRAIEALLRRADDLTPARVEELASHLGPVIAERTGVEASTWWRTLVLAWARNTGRDR